MARAEQPQVGLGKAVRKLREKRGLTQEALAHEAGVTTGTLSMIERGHSNPAWGTARRIAEALDTSLAELARTAEQLES
jgi:transcriptional regulator with XRE-family HTH domain